MTLDELYTIILDRKTRMPKNSYIASLFREGKDRIIQKVGEEAVEVIFAAATFDVAAKGKKKKRIIEETADLWFHSLILLASYGISPPDILSELNLRHEKMNKKYAMIKKEI